MVNSYFYQLQRQGARFFILPVLDVLSRIDPARIADDLWRLVSTPSPTTQERRIAFLFADMLGDAGAEVTVDETIPCSPSVIGRLSGSAPGATFQLAGHMDHIDVPHSPPARDKTRISGRGAIDMKAGLASMLEVVRILCETGCDFPGQVLVTTYGLHETPLGDGAALNNLIDNGMVGDAALVLEGGCDGAIVIGKGQSIWNVFLRRGGQPCHELVRSPDTPDLFEAASAIINALRLEQARIAARATRYPLLGTETLFIGQMHCGDFYNRVPAECHLQGTRRWNPDRDFESARSEFEQAVAGVPLPAGIEATTDWIFGGESFEVDPDAAVIRALRASFRELHGRELPLAGIKLVCDTSRLVPVGKVPTALWGIEGSTAHADFEYVDLENLGPACGMHLLTTLKYLRENADASRK